MAEDMTRSVPTAPEIVTALSNTGFILEYRVAQMLRENEFDTQLNYAYPDPGSGKSREIDVYAYADNDVVQQRLDEAVSITAELVIECKNSSSPFVLVGERGQEFLPSRGAAFITFDPLRLRFPNRLYESISRTLQLDYLPGSPTRADFIGRQLIRMTRQSGKWRADNNMIYDSILYPLAKARQHIIESKRAGFEEDVKEHHIKEWSYPFIYFIFNLVVTAGPVFIVDVTAENPEVKQVGWATLTRDFKASDVSGELLADVVSFDRFQEYLDARIKRMMRAAHDKLSENIHLYNPKWLADNYGEPASSDIFRSWLAEVQASNEKNG
jgi:hypothetical protein